MLIFGNGEFAQVLRYYFPDARLTVHRSFLKGTDEVAFEDADARRDLLMIGCGFSLRRRVFDEAIARGFNLMDYISMGARVSAQHLGTGVIIFEGNNLQPFTSIGENTVLWSGNHVGHHSSIGAHCFITSHCVISGGVTVEDGCFLGVNCTIYDHIRIGAGSIIQAGACVDRDCPPDSLWTRAGLSKVPASKIKI